MNTPRPAFAAITGLAKKPSPVAILEAANQQASEKGILSIVDPTSMLPPAQEPSLPAPPVEPKKVIPARKTRAERKNDVTDVRLAVEVPPYLVKEVRKKAFEQGCTVRFLVIKALSQFGLNVDEEDLIEDRRRV